MASASGTPPIGKKDKEIDVRAILDKAAKSALRGGAAGAAAMVINVCSMMWLRTTINYQYRYGTGTGEALRALWKDGGVPRFYRGLGFALVQGPWSRFGDAAANTGALELLDSFESTKDKAAWQKTLVASVCAASFRMISTPIDTCKTIMQVEGRQGLATLKAKFRTAGGVPKGLPVLWYGAVGSASATFIGHYPWFVTFNMMQLYLPESYGIFKGFKHEEILDGLVRNAITGFCASAVSDTCSNSIRVLKVYKQANSVSITYPQAFREVVAKDGVLGLMGRGLQTKIIANGIQGMLFSILWKSIEKEFKKMF